MSYDTTLELRNLLQEEVNDTSPDAATQTRYANLIDLAHKVVVGGGGILNLDDRGNPIRRPVIFPWALATYPKTLTLLPFQDGAGDVTQLGTTVLNSTINSGTTDMTGWHIRFQQFSTVYRIVSHSGTTLTLDSPYIDLTAAATTFEAFKLVYVLGTNDISLITDKARIFTQANLSSEIAITDSNEMFSEFPLHRVKTKVPDKAAIINQTGGTFTLQFSHYPDKLKRIDFRYVPIPVALNTSGTSDPIIPNASGNRLVLVHLAAYYHLRKRDDDRAQGHLKDAKFYFDSIRTESMQNMNSNDPDYGKVAPWAGGFDGYDANGAIIIEI